MGPVKIALTTAVLSLTTLVGGCGGSSTEAYCTDLEEAKSTFDSLDSGELTDFQAGIDKLREVGEAAPEEVAAEWEVVLGAFDELEGALEEAGITFDDLDAISQGEIPEGVDQEKLATLGEDVQSLESEEFSQAGDAISEHAKSECDIEL